MIVDTTDKSINIIKDEILNEFDYVVDEFNLLRSNNYQYFQSLKSIFVTACIICSIR